MSKREVVGWVVREGKERGKGRYYRANGDWEISQRYAKRYPRNPRAGFGDQYRVVALVKRAPVDLVATDEDLKIFGRTVLEHRGSVRGARMAGIQAVLDGRAKELARLAKTSEAGANRRRGACSARACALQPGGGSEEPGVLSRREIPEATQGEAKSGEERRRDGLAGPSSQLGERGSGNPGVTAGRDPHFSSPVPSHADAGTFSEELVGRMAEAACAMWVRPDTGFRDVVRAVLALLPKSDAQQWHESYLSANSENKILRADLQRMTEQRDALREQANGLAEELDAVRKAAS
jgi:hypothetical protein